MNMIPAIDTPRLNLQAFTLDDAPFLRALVNDPDWLRFIGERNVHTDDDARAYLTRAYLNHYAEHGFGFYVVRRRLDPMPIGMCGLIRRPGLDDVDIGFAFLPAWRGQGYAEEAARASLDFARDHVKLRRVVAIVLPANQRSVALLEKIGMRFEKHVRMKPEDEELALMAIDL